MNDSIVDGLYQAAQFLIDDCYDKEENPVRIIEEGAVEITRLRQENIGLKAKIVTSQAEITRLRALVVEKDNALRAFVVYAVINDDLGVVILAKEALNKE
jgi:hypothetical protein